MPPVKRTPLYRTSLALGATLTDHAGWQVAARFRSPDEEMQQAQSGVGLADASWLGKVEVRCARAAPQMTMRSCGSGVVEGQRLDTARWEIAGATVWPLADGDVLVTCEPSNTPAVRQAIQDQAVSLSPRERPGEGSNTESPSIYVTDVTSVYAALLLAGPHSRVVLQRLTALDLSDPGPPQHGVRPHRSGPRPRHHPPARPRSHPGVPAAGRLGIRRLRLGLRATRRRSTRYHPHRPRSPTSPARRNMRPDHSLSPLGGEGAMERGA